MTKFDPKLVKKIVLSKLIACSTEVGIKNADKISKEMLIPAFLDAVEKAEADAPGSCNANIINTYNEILTTLGLDQEEPPVPEAEAAEPAPVPEPEPPPPPPAMAPRRVGRPATPAAPAAPATPAPAAAAPASPKPPAPAKEPKEKVKRTPPTPKTFNRWTALGDTLLILKQGTLEELVAAANQNYVTQGGKDNKKESATVVKCSLSVLEKMGVVTVTEGNFIVN